LHEVRVRAGYAPIEDADAESRIARKFIGTADVPCLGGVNIGVSRPAVFGAPRRNVLPDVV
jgi:hypothetical protein